jgi:hypothetical protein
MNPQPIIPPDPAPKKWKTWHTIVVIVAAFYLIGKFSQQGALLLIIL